MKKRGSYGFLHLGLNQYNILDQYGTVSFVVLAYPGVVRVDKHRTTLMTKLTTNIDRFEKGEWKSPDGTISDWWNQIIGPHNETCDSRMNAVLDEITEHQERFIAKLITE